MGTKKYGKGEVAKIILSVFLAVGVLTVAIAAPNAVQLFKYLKPKTSKERTRIKKSFYRLEKQGVISRNKKDGSYFTLTKKGRLRAMRCQVEEMKITRQKKWDGKWRLVMFDIPEEKKMARRAVNHALKKIGCIQYQKSVFITPFPCKKEVDFARNVFEIRDHIRVVTAEEIEGGNFLNQNSIYNLSLKYPSVMCPYFVL